MGTKLNPGAFDCYANALPDEPFFVLLARDPLAPGLVTDWAMRYFEGLTIEEKGKAADKFVEAAQCAIAMKAWREANPKPEGGYPKPPASGCLPANLGADEIDPFPDDPAPIADKAVDFVFGELAKALKLDTFSSADGSESWEGDVLGTLYEILRKGGVLDEETNALRVPADTATVKDYEDATNSFLAHVRDLDVAMNGENGAAKRPLIIDIKAQLMDAIRVRKIVDDAITAYVDGMLGRGNGEYLVAQFVGTVSKALGREPIHEYDERRKRGE